MKNIKTFILSILMISCFQYSNSQTINWNALDDTKHFVSIGIGWDYSLSYSLGYGYQFNTRVPLVLHGNVSIPSGEKLFDDLKVKIGGQIVVLNQSNFKGSISLNGIYRRYENPLVRLQNFGSEIKGTFGYYKPKWFVAAEIGFDKAIVTHFKHSKSFKDNIYPEVKDGWYEPTTGGNFQYGLQTGYSFKNSDLTLNIGKIITEDFKTPPQIPYYLMLGFNYKILNLSN